MATQLKHDRTLTEEGHGGTLLAVTVWRTQRRSRSPCWSGLQLGDWPRCIT